METHIWLWLVSKSRDKRHRQGQIFIFYEKYGNIFGVIFCSQTIEKDTLVDDFIDI